MSSQPNSSSSFSSQSTNAKESAKQSIYICSICKQDSTNDKEVIRCSSCNGAIHYACSRLPKYVFFTHSKKKSKKYDCEACTTISEEFEYNLDSFISPSGTKISLMIPAITLTDETGVDLPCVYDPIPEPTPKPPREAEVGATNKEQEIATLNQLFEK